MSTTADRPLHAVPSTPNHKTRFAWALHLKERAGKVLDRMLAATRKAAAYAGRLAEVLHLQGAVRRLTALARSGVGAAAGLVRGVGVLPAATALLTSPLGQRCSALALRKVTQGLAWAGRKVAALARRGLRLLGRPGARLHQRLVAVSHAVRAWVQRRLRAAQVVTGVVDPKLTLRVVHSLAMSVVLHRLLAGLVANRALRFLIETLLVPALVDRGAVRRARRVVRRTTATAAPGAAASRGGEQAASVPVEPAPACDHDPVGESPQGASDPERAVPEQSDGADPDEAGAEVGLEAPEVDLDPEAVELPRPRNRAQRRVHQQAQARARRNGRR